MSNEDFLFGAWCIAWFLVGFASGSCYLYTSRREQIMRGSQFILRSVTALIFAALLLLCLLMSSCSVGMAASGHKTQDASILFPGSNRTVVMSKLGPPEMSRKNEDGTTTDSYLIKEGNERSSGRAWAHAGLDILSLGLWEIIATPYELAQGEDAYRVLIVYDARGEVAEVQRIGKP
jgi:hypothetical protein